MTHICVSKLTIIGSDNGLSPDRRQAIIWTNAGLLLIGPLGTNFNEILIEILAFSFKKMHLKVSSVTRRPFCFGLNVLKTSYRLVNRSPRLIQTCCQLAVNRSPRLIQTCCQLAVNRSPMLIQTCCQLLIQICRIVIQWNFQRNSLFNFKWYNFKDVVCKMTAILSWP